MKYILVLPKIGDKKNKEFLKLANLENLKRCITNATADSYRVLQLQYDINFEILWLLEKPFWQRNVRRVAKVIPPHSQKYLVSGKRHF